MHEPMSQLTAALWYLSLPALIWVSWKFVWLNHGQCERVQADQQRLDGEGPAGD